MQPKKNKNAVFDTVSQAVVTLTEQGGHGVLIAGGYILTAAHCLSFDFSLGRLAAANYLEPATAADGSELRLALVVADVVSDIAVLEKPDAPRTSGVSKAFQAFVENTTPVPLADVPLAVGEIRGHVLNADGGWVLGTVEVISENQTRKPRITFRTAKQIHSGASGGPIVNDMGHLLALVSSSPEKAGAGNHECTGFRPQESLPVWLCNKIRASRTTKMGPELEGNNEPEGKLDIPFPPPCVKTLPASLFTSVAKKGKRKR